jgi:hypothetical protein
LLAGAWVLKRLFEGPGRMEKRENILGKDPLQEKFKIKSIKENLLSSRFPIWKLLEEILSQSILRGCFSYNISLYVRFWLHEISI